MNDKEIIKKLLAVAAKQQKIITKMAQTMGEAGMPVGDATQLGGMHLEPNKTQKASARALWTALPSPVQQVIVNIEERGSDMLVGFKPGAKTQTNYDVVLNKLQELTDSGVIQHPYTLKVV